MFERLSLQPRDRVARGQRDLLEAWISFSVERELEVARAVVRLVLFGIDQVPRRETHGALVHERGGHGAGVDSRLRTTAPAARQTREAQRLRGPRGQVEA